MTPTNPPPTELKVRTIESTKEEVPELQSLFGLTQLDSQLRETLAAKLLQLHALQQMLPGEQGMGDPER